MIRIFTVNSANTSLQSLNYEISCFRIALSFHIFIHFYHHVSLVKCISGCRLQRLIAILSFFWRYIGTFWKIWYGRPCKMRTIPLRMLWFQLNISVTAEGVIWQAKIIFWRLRFIPDDVRSLRANSIVNYISECFMGFSHVYVHYSIVFIF